MNNRTENQTMSPGEHSYGKDSSICPSLSADNHFMFNEDMDDNTSLQSTGSTHDPWMRQSAHIPNEPSADPSVPESLPKTEPSLAEMAKLGHRRTASECLTNATEFVHSSMESLDSLSFRALRSPLSISGDEGEVGHGLPTLTPEKKRAAFDQ